MGLLLSCLLAAACSDGESGSASATATGGEDEPPPPAHLASLCGLEGPRRIFEPAESERMLGGGTRIGERILLTLDRDDPPWTNILWSVDVCGEAIRLTAGVVGEVRVAPAWPDVALVHRDAVNHSEIVAVDPEGSEPSKVLADDLAPWWPFPWVRVSDVGLVTGRYGDGDHFNGATLYRYADGPRPGLEPPVPVPLGTANGEGVEGSDFYCFRFDLEAGSLLRVSLDDLSQEIVATSVSAYAVTPSHLLSVGNFKAHLRERKSGVEATYPIVGRSGTPLLDAETAAIYVDGSDDLRVETVLIDIESGAHHTFAGVRPHGRAPDGRWVLTSGAEVSLADPKSGAREVIADIDQGYSRVEIAEDGVLLIGGDPSILRVPYDGGEEEPLASRSDHDFLRLRDGRVVTTVDVGLVVIDRGTLVERLVDTHVVKLWVEGADVLPPDVIAYQVRDGERSGVYLVNLGDAPVP